MNSLEKSAALAGRFMLSLVFILSGLSKLAGWSSTAGMMASKGIPMANVLLAGTVAIEVLGGLAILFGLHARLAAGILFLFLIPVTLIFHNFWTMQGMERIDMMAHCLKNVSIMGGLLMIVALGAGGYSLDARKRTAQ
jgi:putative oxidoreductase